MAARPMVRWWWPGGDVEDEQLRRELDAMHAAGFGGAEIQAFRIGIDADLPRDVDERVHSFGTETFFDHVRVAAEHARARGMWIDLTFGSGWPFGGPWVSPEHAAVELRYASRSVTGPARYSGAPPMPPAREHRPQPSSLNGPPRPVPADHDERLDGREAVVAVVAMAGDAPVVSEQAPSHVLAAARPVVERSGVVRPETATVLA
ncbi:MAG: hypothetical protein L0227_02695, partial [Chloroflexi bacterium]|nr:hypothetical protein [Chloroflexota bacterium]